VSTQDAHYYEERYNKEKTDMINREKFYDSVRESLFRGTIKPKQFEGMETILNEWDKREFPDIRWLAYMLATTLHETAYTMQPVKEYGSDQYFIKLYWQNEKIAKQLGNICAQDAIDFCGKGYVQITGRNNYKRMGKILNIPLMTNPDLAMDKTIATKILFEGMTTSKSLAGDFTGKHLGMYFNKTTEDWVKARRIINGNDKAQLIAMYALKFFEALK